MEDFGVCMMDFGMDVPKVEMKGVLLKLFVRDITNRINQLNV
jgi:hypothetical protein